MIFHADMKISFSGPHRADRIAELLDELPSGSAERVGEGAVKLLKRVRVRFTPEIALPKKEVAS